MTVYKEKTADTCFTLCDSVQGTLVSHCVTVYSENAGDTCFTLCDSLQRKDSGHLFHTV